MKITRYLFCLLLVLLAACSTTKPEPKVAADSDQAPETVMVTFHVKAGMESKLEIVLQRAWKAYREAHLVFAQPHVIVRDTEGNDKVRVAEIFTWVSHTAPNHVPDSVQTEWKQMHDLTEEREGHKGMELSEVTLWEPKK